jgi:hypothetical protein
MERSDIHRRHVLLGTRTLAGVTLALALAACTAGPRTAPPRPASNPSLTLAPADGSTGVPRSTPLSVTFPAPVGRGAAGREAVERATVLLPGTATTGPQGRLTLEAACSGRWRVANPGPAPAVFTWDVERQPWRGAGVVPGAGEAFFETPPGNRSVRLWVGGALHATARADLTPCRTPLPPLVGAVAGRFGWDGASTRLTFTPEERLAPGQAYTFFVGLPDPGYARFTTAPPVAPNAPEGLEAAPQGEGVALRWRDRSADELGFVLERAEGGGDFAALAALPPGATGHLDGTVQAGVRYRYRVRARGEEADSAPSGEAAFTRATPAAPEGAAAATVSVEQGGVLSGAGVTLDGLAGGPLAVAFAASAAAPEGMPEGWGLAGPVLTLSLPRSALRLDAPGASLLAVPSTAAQSSGKALVVAEIHTRGPTLYLPLRYSPDHPELPAELPLAYLRDVELELGLPDPVAVRLVPVRLLALVAGNLPLRDRRPGQAGIGGAATVSATGLYRVDPSQDFRRFDQPCEDGSVAESLPQADSDQSEVVGERTVVVFIHGWQTLGNRQKGLDNLVANGKVILSYSHAPVMAFSTFLNLLASAQELKPLALAPEVCTWKDLWKYWFSDPQRRGVDLGDFAFYTFRYDSDRRVKESAKVLQAALDRAFPAPAPGQPKPQVVLVGHSMGGMVASHLMRSLGEEGRVRKLITLGTPFRGAIAYECAKVVVEASGEPLCGAVRVPPALAFLDLWTGIASLATYLIWGEEGTKDLALEVPVSQASPWCRTKGELKDVVCIGVAPVPNPYLAGRDRVSPQQEKHYAIYGDLNGYSPQDPSGGSLDVLYRRLNQVSEGVFGLSTDGVVPVRSAAFQDMDPSTLKPGLPGEGLSGVTHTGLIADPRALDAVVRQLAGVAPLRIIPGGRVNLAAGSRTQLAATRAGQIVPAEWTSDRPAVASVDAQGLLTARSPGVAVITATAQSASGPVTATLIVSVHVYAGADWVKRYGGAYSRGGRALRRDPAGGGYYSLGVGFNGGGYWLNLIKFSPQGQTLWWQEFAQEHRVGGVSQLHLEADPGGYAYTGTVDAYSYTLIFSRHAPDGSLAWLKTLSRTGGQAGFLSVSNLALDLEGNLYAAGTVSTDFFPYTTSRGGTDFFLLKYAPTGELTWVRQFGTLEHEHATRLAVDGLGNAYVTGSTTGAFPGQTKTARRHDFFLAKVGSGGDLEWVRQFGSSEDSPGGLLEVDIQGNAFVSGAYQGALEGEDPTPAYDGFVARYSPQGERIWLRTVAVKREFGPRYLEVGPQGVFLVSNYTADPSGAGFAVLRYSPDGSLLYKEEREAGGRDIIAAAAVDDGGNLVVVGQTTGGYDGGAYPIPGPGAGLVMKFGPQGDTLWFRQLRVSGNANIGLGALAMDPDGAFLVEGSLYAELPGVEGTEPGVLLKFPPFPQP